MRLPLCGQRAEQVPEMRPLVHNSEVKHTTATCVGTFFQGGLHFGRPFLAQLKTVDFDAELQNPNFF